MLQVQNNVVHLGIPVRPVAAESFGGLKDDADDFAKTQRDDGEIIAAQTQ